MKNNIKSGNWFENRSEVERMHNSLGFNYESSSIVIADQATTNTERFNRLKSAYEKAKLLTPGGNALSSTNRAVVLVPPGIYDGGADARLVLDTSYVDIIAMNQQIPSTDLSAEQPLNTRIIGTLTGTVSTNNAIVRVAVDDIRLSGLSIENYGVGVPIMISEVGGSVSSIYTNMYFIWQEDTDYGGWAVLDFGGMWVNCVCPNQAAFRLSPGVNWSTGQNRYFTATMINCHGGDYSFGGDFDESDPSVEHYFKGAKFYNCSSTGKAFGGCDVFGIASDSDTLFYECEIKGGGGQSFSLGSNCAATLIRCSGGEGCGGATYADSYSGVTTTGTFSGYAEGCRFGAGSLGGRLDTATTGKLTGTVVRSTVSDSTLSHHLEGALIEDSKFTNAGSNIDCITLDDGNTVIKSSIIEVDSTGTGIPINAASAQDVVAVNCVFNNGANDADGLGANVTNLATTPNNGVY